MKTKVQTEITQATIARGVNRQTGSAFYVVKSDTQANVWYQITWSDEALSWQCDCPAHVACKHQRAVEEVQRIRRATIAVATAPAPRRDFAALNGGGRAFSLLK